MIRENGIIAIYYKFKILNRLVCSKMQKINRQTIKLKIKLKMKTANIRHQTANIPLFASYVMWRVRSLLDILWFVSENIIQKSVSLRRFSIFCSDLLTATVRVDCHQMPFKMLRLLSSDIHTLWLSNWIASFVKVNGFF